MKVLVPRRVGLFNGHWKLALVVATLTAAPATADVFRRDNGALIPGTEGITPGPGVQLDHRELEYGDLSQRDLTGANFESSNLAYAGFFSSTLTNANLSGTVVTGTDFWEATSNGFTKEQLYSTASYQAKDLHGISLVSNDLRRWNLSGQNLANARLANSNLANADLRGTDLTNASLSSSRLANTNLNGAEVAGASFDSTTSRGFTKEQLYSTASYRARDLHGIILWFNDLSGWDFAGQNLANADLSDSKMTDADLSGADLTDASLYYTTLTNANLFRSTLTNAKLIRANLAGANLSGATLTNADLTSANLANAELGGSTLTNAELSWADVTGASFAGATYDGFTMRQLASTSSYRAKNLSGIKLEFNDLNGWSFHGQNMARANLENSQLNSADLSRANLAKASLNGSWLLNANLTGANLANADLGYAVLANADFTGANLTNANLELADLANARLDFAETRGARSLRLGDATSRNAILPDGAIAGLNLAAGERLDVRNYLGDQPVPVTIQDQMMIENGGVLRIIFNAGPWNSVVSFEPGIPVQLDGTLELTFAKNVDSFAQVGHKLRIFDWTGVEPTGSFQIASPTHWMRWDTDELYTTGEVTLAQVPEPATWAIAIIGCTAMFVQRKRCARLRYFPASRCSQVCPRPSHFASICHEWARTSRSPQPQSVARNLVTCPR